jgi:hypothetical protein
VIVKFTQRLVERYRTGPRHGFFLRVNVLTGRLLNRTVTVEVYLGSGYERRMRYAYAVIFKGLLVRHALLHRWDRVADNLTRTLTRDILSHDQ